MVMSRRTAAGSISVGIIMLSFGLITVICGAIVMGKLSGEAAASAGLWSIYYIIPGILCIAAGATKNGVVMGFALFFNIIAVILSTGAAGALMKITMAFNKAESYCPSSGNPCKCHDGTTTYIWDMDCSDLDTIRSIFIVALVVYIILTITTFVAFIFGCLGTCCAPVDPVVVVKPGVPVNTDGTILVTSNKSSMQVAGANPPAYGYVQLPQYGDKSGLMNNMAI